MGRISMTKDNFIKIGGYNQSLLPMSHQDGDIVNRARFNNIKYINFKDNEYNKTITNSKKESLKNCYGNYDYNKMMKINMIYSNFLFQSNEKTANYYFKTPQLGVLINLFQYKNNNFIKIK